MKISNKFFIFLFCLVMACFFSLFSHEASADPAYMGKTCLKCHKTLMEKIRKGKKTHLPVKKGKCIVCHNPHTSNHKGLLISAENKLCSTCHETADFNLTVIHEPVKKGKCLSCHDPHTSSNEKLLVKKKGEICFICHTKESIMSGKESHPLVRKGNCTACHLPHSSSNKGLLKEKISDICSGCHNVQKEGFAFAHLNYSVGGSDCSSCHNPHSSNNKNLLKEFIHLPMAEKKCAACHNGVNDKNPLALKNSGIELCYGCHQDIKKSFNKINNHMIGNRENSCLNCHNPHASDRKSLLVANEDKVCFKCHSDTKERISAKTIKSQHPELENCSSCHSAHGSDYDLFLKAKEANSCAIGECHSIESTFSHPVGPGVVDPRNNKEMTCSTCHDPMGSEFLNNLRADPDNVLCEQCHNI